MNQGYFLNEQAVIANFTGMTAAGTYVPTNGPVRIPIGAIITDLIVVENTALAGASTTYKFFVDAVSGTTDTDLTGAVTLASFTGLNSLMHLASTGVSATMTGKVADTGNLKLTTTNTVSAGDIDVIVKFALA